MSWTSAGPRTMSRVLAAGSGEGGGEGGVVRGRARWKGVGCERVGGEREERWKRTGVEVVLASPRVQVFPVQGHPHWGRVYHTGLGG